MKNKLGKVVLVGALALGGVVTADLVQKPAITASAAEIVDGGIFEEASVWDSYSDQWNYVSSGDAVTAMPGSTMKFMFGPNVGEGETFTVKHYLNGTLKESHTEVKGSGVGPVQYIDISAYGKHKITVQVKGDSNVYSFNLDHTQF